MEMMQETHNPNNNIHMKLKNEKKKLKFKIVADHLSNLYNQFKIQNSHLIRKVSVKFVSFFQFAILLIAVHENYGTQNPFIIPTST